VPNWLSFSSRRQESRQARWAVCGEMAVYRWSSSDRLGERAAGLERGWLLCRLVLGVGKVKRSR
jgi:hypothetical protein